MSRITIAVCACIGLALLGSPTATAQFIQGSDYDAVIDFTNPDNWTDVTIDTATTGTTITFTLNPCEWVVYQDVNGRPLSCLPEPACGELDGMEISLRASLDVWEDLSSTALTFEIDELSGCPGLQQSECPDIGVWEDDGDWVVTRTYIPDPSDFTEENCPDDDTGPIDGGFAGRLYDDPTSDHTTRSITECDVLFFEDKWDNTESDCLNETDLTIQNCVDAWRMALAHELGHCLGFGHSHLTRKTLDPLIGTLGVTLADDAGASIMSYDRRGTIQAAGDGFGPYDKSLYLSTYSTNPDPADDYFAAYGTVKEDCSTPADPVFGAAVIALQEINSTPMTWKPVNMSITGLDPLGDGEFRLEFLDRNETYRLVVVDARDANQIRANGWDFDETAIQIPGRPVFRTDDWSEVNSGSQYKYETSARFDTGFSHVLEDSFDGPGSDDYDAECIEVTFD